jgi:16S rRNA processing protein RimM
MSEQQHESAEPLVLVAHAVKTRGLKGEIVADLLTDFPERFEGLSHLWGVAPSGARKWLELENHWFHKGRLVLKFVGYDNIEAAQPLVGFDFGVLETERVQLEADEFYNWELEGCQVETVAGEVVGQVLGIISTGGVEVLLIADQQKHERLVPMAESIVVEIDIEKKRIRIDPPEGLLEL